jgi:predicted RNA-binding Zn-ribbon protein involved in translation (DUF1610 family)
MNALLTLLLFTAGEPPAVIYPDHLGPPAVVHPKRAAPVVAAKTFRSGDYHAGHDCPNCHRIQTDIADDRGPGHTHVCSHCGTAWHHDDGVRTMSSGASLRRIFGTGRFR